MGSAATRYQCRARAGRPMTGVLAAAAVILTPAPAAQQADTRAGG
jgi:hypothetical protein